MRYSSYSFSSAAALFTFLTLNAAKFSIPFGRVKGQPQAWWSSKVEGAFREKRKAFAFVHRSDEEQKAYITVYRKASSIIAKAKAEVWHKACSSLYLKSDYLHFISQLVLVLFPLSLTFSAFLSKVDGIGVLQLPEISLFCFSANGFA